MRTGFGRQLLFIAGIAGMIAVSGCKTDNPVAVPTGPTELEDMGMGWSGNDEAGIQWDYSFINNAIVIKRESVELYRGTFTLDTTTAPDKKIDISITKSSEAGAAGKKILTLYRHEFDANILFIMYNVPGAPRPTVWGSAAENPIISLAY